MAAWTTEDLGPHGCCGGEFERELRRNHRTGVNEKRERGRFWHYMACGANDGDDDETSFKLRVTEFLIFPRVGNP